MSKRIISDQIYLTSDGRDALEAELRALVEIRRPTLFDRLHDALADGDADNGGMLDETKDDLAQVDRRVREIENILRNALALPAQGHGVDDDTVRLGSHILVRDACGEEQTWGVVGSAEANRRAGKISSESPVGAALLGRKVGETVTVHALAGDTAYTIVRVF